MQEAQFVSDYFDQMDDSFTWYVPENKDELINALIKETGGNPHLHIHKYASSVDVLAKHKTKNDVLYMLPNKECALVHLTYGSKSNEKVNGDLHFVFFSNCQSAVKYIERQYRTEYLGEKEFILAPKDKFEILLFLVQILLFFILPGDARETAMIISGIIMYILILYDWKVNGFNLFRDRKLDHSKVIPLLKYQIAYFFIMTLFIVAGIILAVLNSVISA